MSTVAKSRPLLDPLIVRRALYDSLVKLDPRHQVRNPVMFTVFVGAILTALLDTKAKVIDVSAPDTPVTR